MSWSVRYSSRSVRSFIAHSLAQLPGPGKSAATFGVETPIDPVVPSNTTFLGFIKTRQHTGPLPAPQAFRELTTARPEVFFRPQLNQEDYMANIHSYEESPFLRTHQ